MFGCNRRLSWAVALCGDGLPTDFDTHSTRPLGICRRGHAVTRAHSPPLSPSYAEHAFELGGEAMLTWLCVWFVLSPRFHDFHRICTTGTATVRPWTMRSPSRASSAVRHAAQKAMDDHARGECDEFALHGGVACERLAKAVLVSRNPAYLVEIRLGNSDMLLYLCGDPELKADKVRKVDASKAIKRLRPIRHRFLWRVRIKSRVRSAPNPTFF